MLKKLDAPGAALAIVIAVFVLCALVIPSHETNNEIANAYSQYDGTQQLSLGGVAEIVAAIATVLLAMFAFVQVRDSRVSSERQLRAYVNFHRCGVEGILDGHIPVVKFAFRNTGQTPARHLACVSQVAVLPYPLTVQIPTPDFSNPLHSRDALPSRGTAWVTASLGSKLTVEQLQCLERQTHAVYLWGAVEYRDVFGKSHVTRFCRFTGGLAGLRDGDMVAYHQGGESD